MAIDLGAAASIATSAINGVNSTLGTLTKLTSPSASNFSLNTNAVSRNISQFASTPNISLGGVNIAGLANQLLGDNAAASKLIGQAAGAFGAINKVSGALGIFGNKSGNPLSVSNLVGSALKTSGLGSFADTIESLGSLGGSITGSIGAFNASTVANRSTQEVTGAVGGQFDQARKFAESYKPDVGVGAGAQSSSNNNKSLNINSAGRIENPLRVHNHYNYIITLGILDAAQLNNPDSYRSGSGFKKVLIRSGGGLPNTGYNTRIRTSAEGEENAEYYIDDLEIGAVISPNKNTGVALGTNVTFKIIEPFSMGKVIEAMLVGSRECGYAGYMDAPFCIKIEFYGWDDRGEVRTVAAKPSYVPIKINKMELHIGAQGSTYDCTAVPYSEAALGDTANKTRVAVSAYGTTVHDVLENSKESVTYTINGQIENLEEKKVIKGYDRYLIAFPRNRQDLQNAIKRGDFDPAPLKATIDASYQEQIRLGVSQPVTSSNAATATQSVPVIGTTAPNTYLYLKSWASNAANMNPFGLSLITTDTRDGGDQPHQGAGSAVNPETKTVQRQDATSAVAEKSRKFNFSSGATITQIIEEVLLSSAYVKELATKTPVNGFKQWFRIETLVFIEPSTGAGIECEIGRPRKTYVYAVHPFWTYEARHNAPSQAPVGIDKLKALAKKEYNYYYTGKNEDVLNFDINFNNAFFQNVRADMGQNASTSTGQSITATGARPGVSLAADAGGCKPTNEQSSTVELTAQDQGKGQGGTRISTVDDKTKRAIADMFHNRLLNSPVDMITAEMDIWGDPYYLPSDVGNYSAAPGAPSVTGDGTMAYMRDEVYVVVNFRTPLDYLIRGSKMNIPTSVPAFSGLYQVISTTSNFAGGQYKNKIKMIRVPGQTAPATVNGSGVVTESSNNSLVIDPSAYAEDNPQNAPPKTPTVNVTAELTNILNTNSLTGAAASFSQERLMTGAVSAGTDKIVINPVASIQEAFKNNAAALAALPIDTSSRLGITSNLTTTIFPLKLPNGSTDLAAASAAAVALSTGANKLRAQGLNAPAGFALPNFNSASSLLSGVGSLPSLAAQASVLASQAAGGLNRIQSSVNSAVSGVSTQARALGIRPPTGLG